MASMLANKPMKELKYGLGLNNLINQAAEGTITVQFYICVKIPFMKKSWFGTDQSDHETR